MPMTQTNDLFTFCKGYQRSSTELVVYSREVKQLVQVAYPTCFGKRIVASRVHAFLQRRGVFWECFCGFESDDPVPARFVTIVNGAVAHSAEVRCHHYRSQCGFRLNLNETRHTAQYLSEYEAFQTVEHGVPDVAEVTADFHRTVTNVHGGLAQTVPFFAGYLGSPSALYPGANLPILDVSFERSITRNARSHVWRHSATFPALQDTSCAHRTSLNLTPSTSAGPAIAPSTGINPVPDLLLNDEDSPKECDLLHALANGLSIDKIDAEGLVEVCTRCRKAFMASHLRRHIKSGKCGTGKS